MPSEKYAIEIGGPQRLELSRKLFREAITVRLDGNVIGTIANGKELKEGRTFQLADGSTITVKQVREALRTKIRVLMNGQPTLDSASDPVRRFEAAYGVVFLAGGLSIVLGLWAEISQDDFLLHRWGLDWVAIVWGLLLVALGFLARQKSNTALAVAIAVLIASGAWSFYVVSQQTVTTYTVKQQPQSFGKIEIVPREVSAVSQKAFLWSLVARVFLLVIMVRGFSAISTLKRINSPEKE